MLNKILEQEFLLRKKEPIEYIGIYELDCLIDDNQLDCEGIIVAFSDKLYLIKSLSIGEDDYEFFYYEFSRAYDCRKILSSDKEPIYFVRKEEEEDSFRMLRFQIGNRPILATALASFLLYKERFSKAQLLGILLGTASIVCLSI